MGVYAGPDLKEDGLVLCLDGANLKSFKGEVTTNIVSDAGTMSSWGSYANGNDGTFTTEFGTTGYKMINRGSWNGIRRGVTLPSAGTYTISAWFRYWGGAADNNGATVYTSGGGISDTAVALNKSLIGVWQRVSMTRTYSTTGITFYLISYGGTNGGSNSTWDVTMPQIEQKSYVTNFVDGTRGSTVATGGGWADLTGNGNHGELVNGVRESSDNLGALVFDGTDEYVTTTLGTYTPYCIDIWFKNDDNITSAVMQGNYQQLLGVGTYPGGITLGAWTSTATDETFSFFSAGWSSNGMTYIRDTASPGIHNLVVNWNGSSFDFWLDGTKRVTYASTYGHRTLETVTGFQIGSAYNNANSYEFDGNVYSVKVYTSQLSDSQVQQNFNATRSRFGI